MLLYLTDSRRVQKVLWRQLFVLDSSMSLLEGLESAQQLMKQPCPPQPDGGARGRWKALKAENRLGLEETEALLRSLHDKIHQIHSRRNTLTQLMKQLHSKKHQCEQLEQTLQKAQNALRSCNQQLTHLREESEAVLSQLMGWRQLKAERQELITSLRDLMTVHLLTFNQSELCIGSMPHVSSNLSSNQNGAPKLSVIYGHDGCFSMQESEGTAILVEERVMGKRNELGAALLEVMQCYDGQAELLSEIQTLRTSFAIDWRPAQRLLVYLKSASLVCHLEVEEGYPSCGQVRLLSIRRDGQLVDTSGLKPPKNDLNLTDWLVFLCSSPLV
ncbi:uncharacterized protein LOC114440088 isoform X2 [Parambassis ranga]|nr:uncharacterized protein LOC114440088 isoform X2 [Parambassis ranga]